MLYEQMAQPCILLRARSEPDGEGGFVRVWHEDEAFAASLHRGSGSEEWRFSVRRRSAQDIGGRQREAVSWLVTTAYALQTGDVFRRVSDGRVFRVCSAGTDVYPPDSAGFFFYQCAAEELDPRLLEEGA